MVRRSPSERWTKEHGGKIAHRWRWQAVWHAWQINTFRDDGRGVREPYPCQWGQWYRDGETAPRHWHVGRPSTHHKDGYEGQWPGYPPECQTGNKV